MNAPLPSPAPNHDDEHRASSDAKRALEQVFGHFLDELVGEDWREDEHYAGTPERVARMYVDELCAGLYNRAPKVVRFSAPRYTDPSTYPDDAMAIIGPLSVQSLCAHHFLPVTGTAWVGLIPGSHYLGLSKYGRLIRWHFARPTMQETATAAAARYLDQLIEPRGLALLVRARHGCMSCRGVRENDALFTTTHYSGLMRDARARDEFLSLVRATENHR